MALGVAACWGAADFLGGITTRGLPVAVVVGVSQAFGALLLLLALVVFRPAWPEPSEWAWGLAGGVSLAVGLGALYAGLARGVMSIVSPISATGAAIPIAYGLATGERPSALQWAGIALAIVGIVVVSRQPGASVARSEWSAGIALALVAALGFGSFFVLADLAEGAGVLHATFAQRIGLLMVVACVVAVTRPAVSAARGRLLPLLAIGVLDTSATGLFVAATGEGLTSVVSVVASLYPAFTIVLAFAILHERLAPSQAAGAGGALAGVMLMAAG
jgi:drug/metabolite transporter (DMT)-like permease